MPALVGVASCFKPDIEIPSEQPLGKGATKLAFVVEPASVKAGVVVSPAVTVAVQNADGAVVEDAQNRVLLALGAGSPGLVLNGTVSVTPQSGVATFADLVLPTAGNGYSLVATSPDLVSATSSRFSVTP
ncbi:MAG: hypothetical protein HY903_03085 [Deltaproteobacteria bacterium]|nr:hypothetical protein [Deltaproteobacteria bacterium]